MISVLHVLWAVAGLNANPDFSTGASAMSVQVLGMDYSGWHAVGGFLLFLPGIVLARRPGWARLFALSAIPAGVLPAAWTLFDDRPLGLLVFDNTTSDVVLHLATAGILAALVIVNRLSGRRPVRPVARA